MEGIFPFLSALGLVLAMELGDKSQLATISLASRHPWRPVFLGAAAGLVAATAIGAAIGAVIATGFEGALVPVRLVGGVVFVGLGVRELYVRGAGKDPEPPAKERRSAAATAFSVNLLAEMGDKTQIAVIVLAGGLAAPISVFAGAAVALTLMAGMSVFVGVQVARRLKEETVRKVSAGLFVVAGVLLIAEALLGG